MKQERAFSRDGFYMFVLESNLMLHEHVAERGQQLLLGWCQAKPRGASFKVLDLACGGTPFSISRMMAACSDREFHYTGIDINPDQVEAARAFKFSANVVKTTLLEGNAWDLSTLPPDESYDIIFTGMNTHHGSPPEIYCLLLQVKGKLSPGGIYINHDLFRPATVPHLTRPQFNPEDPSESFAMVSDEILNKYHAGDLISPVDHDQIASDWRDQFLERYVEALQQRGAHEAGITQVVDHIRRRDFPVSTADIKVIAEQAGFNLSILDLGASAEPLYQYFSLVCAIPR